MMVVKSGSGSDDGGALIAAQWLLMGAHMEEVEGCEKEGQQR